MKVQWHGAARFDLLEIAGYVANDSLEAAYQLIDEIEEQVAMLARLPAMGRPGRVPGTRELVISGTSYVAPYRITAEKVIILRILHGARRWPRHF
jgi:toxin ParE1/3/4